MNSKSGKNTVNSQGEGSRAPKKTISSAQQAYDCALNLLSYRDFSDKKMRERLQQKGADEEQAEEAIQKLQHYGLLNEERYAQRVYEAWLRKRSYGKQHLKAELAKRGVRSELIREVLESFTPELEAAQAENAAELFLERNRKKLSGDAAQDKKIYAAAGRFMAARGFSTGYMTILWEKLRKNHDI